MTLDTKALANMTVSIIKDGAIMYDKAFQPNPLTIKVGNTVRWTNDDIVIHTVTSGSGPNDPGEGKQFSLPRFPLCVRCHKCLSSCAITSTITSSRVN